MKKALILQISILCLVATAVSAQRTKRFKNTTESTSVVKFTPTKIFRGGIIFGYEHGVGDRSSLEISAGPTVSNVSPFGSQGHGLFDLQDGLSNSTGSSVGFHVAAGFRYYPVEEKWVMNGFYVSPEISFTQYNYLFKSQFDPSIEETGNKQETAFGFLFGSQQWLSKSFGIDMYCGMGLKSVSTKTYFSDYDYVTETPTWITRSDSRASWYLTMGVKIGIGLTTTK